MATSSQQGKLVDVHEPNNDSGKLDLRIVCDELGSIKNKWQVIGIQLGIPRTKLQDFKEEDDPLSAVIDYWLRGNATESSVPISWQSIVAALKSKHVDEHGLAEQIREKYCQNVEAKSKRIL